MPAEVELAAAIMRVCIILRARSYAHIRAASTPRCMRQPVHGTRVLTAQLPCVHTAHPSCAHAAPSRCTAVDQAPRTETAIVLPQS